MAGTDVNEVKQDAADFQAELLVEAQPAIYENTPMSPEDALRQAERLALISIDNELEDINATLADLDLTEVRNAILAMAQELQNVTTQLTEANELQVIANTCCQEGNELATIRNTHLAERNELLAIQNGFLERITVAVEDIAD